MKSFVQIVCVLGLLILAPQYSYAEKKDCSCKPVTCGPCQKKVNVGKVVKFCDWGDINVCRKVICENVNYYFSCLSKRSKARTEDEAKTAKNELNLLYEKDDEKVKSKKVVKRAVASQKKNTKSKNSDATGRIEVGNESRVMQGDDYSTRITGQVALGNSQVKLFHRGKSNSLKKGKKVYVGDELSNTTKRTQRFSLKFENGQINIKLKPRSQLSVQDPQSIIGRFQPFLYLVHGGVEFVTQLKHGSVDILAGQVLSRSFGGSHQVMYEMGKEGLKVKVESFKNHIDVIKAQDLSGQTIQVQAGNFVSWISETPGHLFNRDEKMALAGEGFITPVFEMTEIRKRKLGLIKAKKTSLFADWTKLGSKKNRNIASLNGVSEGLCQAPQANYQQCAWSCEGNSKKAKDCQAEKNNVHCVRRACNAAGQWGAPTAFASSYKDLCPASGTRVGECSP